MRTEGRVKTKPDYSRAAAKARSLSVEPRPPASRRLAWPCLAPALATGLLLWLCYFPVAWGWLGWVALVPLLCLVRSEARPRRVYLAAWAGGSAFFWPALQWMRVADYRMYATWAMLALYCSLYCPLAVWLLRRLDRGTGLPLVVTVPAVWTALELLRAHLLSGFAWYYLGHTQHDFLALIQVADVTGAYGVTFLVAAVNALAFEALYLWPRFRTFLSLPAPAAGRWRWALAAQAGAVALLLGAVLAYGVGRLGQEEFTPGPRVALLQSNLDQRLRNFAAVDPRAREDVGVTYLKLCEKAREEVPRPDLVVWPETSFPDEWFEVSPKLPDAKRLADGHTVKAWRKGEEIVRRRIGGFAEFCDTSVLFGVNSETVDDEGTIKRYNSALLARKVREGKGPRFRLAGRYDKIHRVPFGEFVPLRDWLPLMDLFAPYDYDYSIRPGVRQNRLPVTAAGSGRTYHFGVLICYEDTDPDLARNLALPEGGEPAADFVLNISNDGWFDGTSEHEEHLAICRFRAVESRRPVARAVNMGVSAVIDGSGRVLRPSAAGGRQGVRTWKLDEIDGPELPLADWHRFKKVEGVLTATIPLDTRSSLYARWGDWLPWGCWLILAGGLLAAWVRRRRLKPVGLA